MNEQAVAPKLAASDVSDASNASLEGGVVERVVGGLRVRLPGGLVEAVRAKSCLVAPEVGDRVLCATNDGELYVLAVLTGRAGGATRIATDGDLKLQAASGRVSIAAGVGVDILGAKDVALCTDALQLRARTGSVAIEELGVLGRIVRTHISKVSIVADEIDSRFERLAQRAKRVFRFVEEIEQLRAGTVDMRAEHLAAVRGENTIVSARVLAKIDGEQVHIG